jgi:hypothetical protein
MKKSVKQKRAQAALFAGADEQIRTAYLFITNEVLYRLSYISIAISICCGFATNPL